MIRKTIIVVLALAAVGTATLWVESYGRNRIKVLWHRLPNDAGSTGLVCFRKGAFEFGVVYPVGETLFQHFPSLDRGVRLGGFACSHFSARSPAALAVAIPAWTLPLLFATYPTMAFIRGPLRRHRRRKRGLCLTCGYDLTGNVTGVCSECGMESATR